MKKKKIVPDKGTSGWRIRWIDVEKLTTTVRAGYASVSFETRGIELERNHLHTHTHTHVHAYSNVSRTHIHIYKHHTLMYARKLHSHTFSPFSTDQFRGLIGYQTEHDCTWTTNYTYTNTPSILCARCVHVRLFIFARVHVHTHVCIHAQLLIDTNIETASRRVYTWKHYIEY